MKIDQLNISLPIGFEGRAHTIVDIVGQILGQSDHKGEGHIASLTGLDINISKEASNQEIGENIANAIQAKVSPHYGGTG